MTLTDLRRAAIRRQQRVRFRLSNGLECVIDEHGLARIPELRRAADFSIETELDATQDFRLEGNGTAVTMSRDQIVKWAVPASGAAVQEEQDE